MYNPVVRLRLYGRPSLHAQPPCKGCDEQDASCQPYVRLITVAALFYPGRRAYANLHRLDRISMLVGEVIRAEIELRGMREVRSRTIQVQADGPRKPAVVSAIACHYFFISFLPSPQALPTGFPSVR